MFTMVSAIVVTLLFLGFSVTAYYSEYYTMLSDDVEFNRSKRTLKRRRKKQMGFWRRFLFLDVRQYITNWHYFLFLCFLVSTPIVLVFLNAYVITENPVLRKLTIISGIPYFASMILTSVVRWDLYKWNVTRKRPTKRRP